MKVKVKVITGASHVFEIPPTATVRFLKTEIHRVTAHIIDEMQLLFQRKLLEDSQPLVSAGIVENSDVYLVIRLTSGFDLFVKTLAGKTLTIGVLGRYSIMTLKHHIQDKEEIPPKDQVLIFASEELKDEKTIQSYNIKPESTLYMMIKVSSSLPQARAETHLTELRAVSRRVNLDATSMRGREAAGLKKGMKSGTSAERMPSQVLEKSKCIPKAKGFKVLFHLFSGEKIDFSITDIDVKVGALMQMVAKKYSIQAADYKLYVGGTEMHTETSLRMFIPLSNIKQPIKVISKKDRVVCETSKSEKFNVELFDGISVSDITQRICKAKSLQPETVVLFLAGRQLSNSSELLEMLTCSSVITVHVKLSLFVRDLGGKLTIFDLQDADSVSKLRSIISNKLNVQMNKCILKYRGQVLSDVILAAVPGMKNDDVVHLQTIGNSA